MYDKARELLDSRIADGTFITDTDKAYYVYELTMNGRTQTGIAACASIDDYNNNIIKKHENTRADKEQDRINHVDRCSAQTGPIFLAYRADEVIRNEVAKAKETKPLYSFTSPDGIRHQVYKISNAQSVENIEKAFAGIDDIYVYNEDLKIAMAKEEIYAMANMLGWFAKDFELKEYFPPYMSDLIQKHAILESGESVSYTHLTLPTNSRG
mgnify:CR=1 FL=1